MNIETGFTSLSISSTKMLIKPWGDLPNPRHAIEEDENATPIIPDITIDITNDKFDYVIISPKSINVIPDSFQTEKVGKINIDFNPTSSEIIEKPTSREDLKIPGEEEEEYDEDEQLYRAIKPQSSDENISLPIFKLKTQGVLFVVTPNFSNGITNHQIAEKVVKAITAKNWITLSPSLLNNGQTINKLLRVSSDEEVKPSFANSKVCEQIPYLRPPHFITGISASFNSILNYSNSFLSIALNSDGQPGYEKLDNDAIIDTTYVLVDLIIENAKEKEEILSNVSKSIRKFNSYSNSGMYL